MEKILKTLDNKIGTVSAFFRRRPLLTLAYLVAFMGITGGFWDGPAWLVPLAALMWMFLGYILAEWLKQPSLSVALSKIMMDSLASPGRIVFNEVVPGIFAVDRIGIPGQPGSFKVKYPIRGYASILVSRVCDGYVYYYSTHPYLDGKPEHANAVRAVKGMLQRAEIESYDPDEPVKNVCGGIPYDYRIDWVDRTPDFEDEIVQLHAEEISAEMDRRTIIDIAKTMERPLTDEEVEKFKESLEKNPRVGMASFLEDMPLTGYWRDASDPPTKDGSYLIRTPKGWVYPEDGEHANGLFSVPFDGYAAILHKGERVVPAREVAASRNYNSNLYVESMYMNNGTDAAGLAAAMAAAQRRTMRGYGS